MLDETDGFKWLGSAATKSVGGAWKKVSLEAEVAADVEGHLLDVSLFFVGGGSYYLDDIELSAPERVSTTLLNLTFETSGAGGESDAVPLATYVAKPADPSKAPHTEVTASLLELEAPKAGAGFHSAHGAQLSVRSPFASPSDAKLRLTKLTAVPGTVNISLWAKLVAGGAGGAGGGGAGGAPAGGAAPATPKKKKGGAGTGAGAGAGTTTGSGAGAGGGGTGRQLATAAAGAAVAAAAAQGPFVKIDLLDETAGFEWLGAWMQFELSATEWRRVEALIHVPASRAGHTLDAALVVGGAAPGLLLDEIVVSAPPIVGAGIPVKALALTFDDDAAVKHIGVVHTGGSAGAATALGGGSSVRVQLRSPHAALSGAAGAMLTVLSALEPPASARLVVCQMVCAMPGVLKVVIWARTPEKHPAPKLSVDIFDVSDGWKWLGVPDDFRLTTSWQRIEVSTNLPLSRVGHKLEIALQVGRAAGIMLLDDLEVWGPRSTNGTPPRVMPPPLPEAARGGQASPPERPA